MRQRLIALLFLVLIDISISSEVQKNNEKRLINSEVLNKKLLPDVKHLMKDNIDGNRQKFLHLLNDLEVDGYKFVNDAPFTIIIPNMNFDIQTIDKSSLQQFVFEHIIPGTQIKALKNGEIYGNMNHNTIEIKSLTPDKWTVNDANVLKFNSITAKLISFVEIDGYLNDRKNNNAKRNIQDHNSYNEPQKLVQKDVNKSDATSKGNKVGLLQNYLSTMKSGTKVFQHFLSTSNLSQILEDTSVSYIILVPSDSAFQRWHPIDWGFYPFSVPEFTEDIMRNHVIPQKQQFNLKLIDKEHKMKTLGGEIVVFNNQPIATVNNVSIMSNATLANGNDVFIISEVLFMTDSKVSKLHQQNKDKETPPLLAFPWFGSQFLSHAFLALERDNRFTQITRFFHFAEIIASSIVGSNYTFFVPFDDAFEKYGFDQLPDTTISSKKFVSMILNHFVKGRLYDRDLTNDAVFDTVGGKTLKITRDSSDRVFVNGAKIVESEVFVYNLGTMFYIDDIFFPEILEKDYKLVTQPTKDREDREDHEDRESSEDFFTTEMPNIMEQQEKLTTKTNREPTTSEHHSVLQALLTTRADVEFVPSAFSEFAEEVEDFSNAEVFITPKALPSRLISAPPKK
ncbi:unnamed protein product [Chironomus riparius]|uniref:FAS1 domain-containing protein n=1 Tax=Chironomus riparius TaxID=315576 RepID=A0A9N9RL57_9DIPT|nr:unnamed protein product [Chironomus riparius]